MIPAGHLVRVVNRAVEQIDLEPLLRKYKGGGTSSYHPRMMLKVLVYAYAYFEEHHLGSYVKYNTFHREQQKHRKPALIRKALFRSENFPYDAETDTFICPDNQRLTYRGTRRERTENGYWAELRHYEATSCNTCPLKPECTRAKGNRHMRVSFRLRRYREQAKNNLLSEQGKLLSVLRNVEVESVFCLPRNSAPS